MTAAKQILLQEPSEEALERIADAIWNESAKALNSVTFISTTLAITRKRHN
jgi:hypothetical protein